MAVEIKILCAQLEALLQPQPGAIQERDDDPGDSIEALHDARDLATAQDDRHTKRHAGARHVLDGADFDVQYIAIQEQQGAERLIL